MRRLFFAFLGPVTKSYMEHYSEHYPSYSLSRWLETTPPSCWIHGAFTWEGQPEGWEFWCDLSFTWQRMLDVMPENVEL